ncbi:unnamed protein product [Mytilus coruscus]|uniref:IRG-type G domain-containing protein n=1 Tax=Mytilus coruscus TaxID=42192 RepID=A0A6J8BY66_MYTCO|nr:unnamed protein product [Mytilus coruscus]
MGQNQSKITIYESDEMKVLKKILDKDGPAAANTYLERNINRWKTETVKFAVSGCTATGKSTFINSLRNVKRGDKGYADVGFGDTTKEPTPYSHPDNDKIVYYDLPGVGTLEIKKENFINDMKISDYDFIFIFFDKVITEDNLWLVVELDKIGKPYCFVRSKLDEDMKNAERENIDTATVLPTIREKIKKSLEKNDKFNNSKKIFFISSVDKKIGEMSELVSYVESNVDKFKCEAVMSSMAVFSEDIIHLKHKVLKRRIKLASVAAAAIAATPVPGVDFAVNVTLLVEEVNNYIKCFSLSAQKMESLENFDRSNLKCSKILVPKAKIATWVIFRLGIFATVMAAENVLDLLLPLVGSLISGVTTAAIAYKFLNGVLDDIRDDAIDVYRHIVKQQSNIRL